MTFQIHSLQADKFAHLFGLEDEQLHKQGATRQIVKITPGTPCRVSMTDAEVGETVILLNYCHQPADSPYKSSHAIFIREGVKQAIIKPNTVPDVLSIRLISIRLFNSEHMMIDANVVDGKELAGVINKAFLKKEVAYIHLHNAKPGCFAAKATRA